MGKNPIYVLGVYSRGHDLSCCLLRDGEIICIIEEERLTRYKHAVPKELLNLWPKFGGKFGYFPWAAMNYCLESAGIGIDDLDSIVLDEYPASSDFIPIKDKNKIIVFDEPKDATHHYSHALSAYLASPFERSVVLVVDGDGSINHEGYEAESGYVFEGRTGSYKTVFKNRYPLNKRYHGGLGWMYDYISMILGFVSSTGYLTDPGKTMGLAPYGSANSEYSKLNWLNYEGFTLDFSPFHNWLQSSGLEKLCQFSTEKSIIQSFSNPPQQSLDLAFKVQNQLEESLLYLVKQIHKEIGGENLCLAGGTFLNSVANSVILEQGPFKNIFIQPAAADNGQAIGMAYFGHLKVSNDKCVPRMRNAFGGRKYKHESVHQILIKSGLSFQEISSDEDLTRDAAEELEKGQIVGWHQGASEFGPRALGHRSILADPRSPNMKDHLNNRVKFRESFRPFAPSVMSEYANEIFNLKVESPYMLLVSSVNKQWAKKIPAVVHVDGTARVQTVCKTQDPLYYALISAFNDLTGIPVVLNTSFNLRGMPIVETPLDALQCFMFTEMDLLYIGRFKICRPESHQIFLRLDENWRFVIRGSTSAADIYFENIYGQRIDVTSDERMIHLCQAFDGVLSLEELTNEVFDSASTTDKEHDRIDLFVQKLLREGVLNLRVGLLEFFYPSKW